MFPPINSWSHAFGTWNVKNPAKNSVVSCFSLCGYWARAFFAKSQKYIFLPKTCLNSLKPFWDKGNAKIIDINGFVRKKSCRWFSNFFDYFRNFHENRKNLISKKIENVWKSSCIGKFRIPTFHISVRFIQPIYFTCCSIMAWYLTKFTIALPA